MAKRTKTIKYEPNGYSTPSPKPPAVHAYWLGREMGNWTDPCAQKKPPNWVLDLIAEEKITGRFNTAPDNLCPRCQMYKTVAGTCWC